MDITLAKLTAPQLRARFCPVYWEPQAGCNERITALIAVVPEEASSAYLAPAAHCILPAARLRAMMGTVRGNSAYGIVMEVASFITKQLIAGLPLDEITAPFAGFAPGAPGTARGFSVEQLLTAAVHMVSTLGSIEDFIDDTTAVDARLTTATTRTFLINVRKKFAGDSKVLRQRFNHKYQATGTPEITLDYQFRQWLVQFASLPATTYQSTHMQREAESKMFEIITARTTIQAETRPLLIINSQAISSDMAESRMLAHSMLDRFTGLASMHGFGTFSASTEQDAVNYLENLTY